MTGQPCAHAAPPSHGATLEGELPLTHLRRTLVTRSILVISILAGLLTLGPIATAQAATLTDDARSLRDSVVVLTQDYERNYGTRVTTEERTELQAMGAQARREMNALVSAVRRAERTEREIDWRKARVLHTSALTTAEARFDRAAALLQPRLSLGEQLRAYSDYTRTMREFERLGQRIPVTAAR